MDEPDPRLDGYLAEFESATALRSAVAHLEDSGYARIETFSPIPIPERHRSRRTRLPLIVFIAGAAGGAAGYALQWYANVYAYPLAIGGRPAHAIPAFMIPAFEGTILAAAFAAFIGFFVLTRLPAPWHPVFEVEGFERATVDRYWLALGATGTSRDAGAAGELTALGAVRVERMEAGA